MTKELIERLYAFSHDYACIHCGCPALQVNSRNQVICLRCLGENPNDEKGAVMRQAAQALADAQNLIERLRLEAESHALEARAQRATVHECYRAVTGGKGEPGDWNGAEPVKRFVADAQKRIERYEAALRQIAAGTVPQSRQFMQWHDKYQDLRTHARAALQEGTG